MINKEPNVYSFNDECYVYLGDYKNLQTENQQLKSTLEEIREYINSKVISNGEIIDQLRKTEVKEILQIIDKGVK